MIRRPPRSTQSRSSAASDVYKRQDSVCRIGGDEFGFVMPETSPEEAGRICSRIVDVLRTECTSLGWQATASIGYAGYPADADDKEELLRRADGAQYWAKYHG